MKFSEVTSAVHEAWQFAWPPVISGFIAFKIAVFVYPSGTEYLIASSASAARRNADVAENLKATLEPFGLTALIPIISLILVVACLYLVNLVCQVLPSRLPPFVSYRPDVLWSQRATAPEKLLLLRLYPTARDSTAAFTLAYRQQLQRSVHTRPDIAFKMQNLFKFALLVAVASLVVSAFRNDLSAGMAGRFLLIAIILSWMWLCALLGYLYRQEQQFFDDLSEMTLGFQERAVELLREPPSLEETRRASDAPASVTSRWWSIDFFFPGWIAWMRRTLHSIRKRAGH